ncbi:MAG TPA: hypothetical protein VE090_03420 [Methylomirabilota bacterium]|nr:hypothetical protein [Methylomirabilota bacterium]
MNSLYAFGVNGSVLFDAFLLALHKPWYNKLMELVIPAIKYKESYLQAVEEGAQGLHA